MGVYSIGNAVNMLYDIKFPSLHWNCNVGMHTTLEHEKCCQYAGVPHEVAVITLERNVCPLSNMKFLLNPCTQNGQNSECNMVKSQIKFF